MNDEATSAISGSTLPSVAFASGGNRQHEQEYQEVSGIYMIAMASEANTTSSSTTTGAYSDSQSASLLAAAKTVVASVASAPPKAMKKLIFQLDDQRDTFDQQDEVYLAF